MKLFSYGLPMISRRQHCKKGPLWNWTWPRNSPLQQRLLGCIRNSTARWWREMILPFCSPHWWGHIWSATCSARHIQHKRDEVILERVQWRPQIHLSVVIYITVVGTYKVWEMAAGTGTVQAENIYEGSDGCLPLWVFIKKGDPDLSQKVWKDER